MKKNHTHILALTALFLAMGFVLHSLVPAVFGMKFDLLLTFMILAIGMNPTVQNALAAGVVSGLITALTTTFPGGQIPNIIDKIITALVVFAIIQVIRTLKMGTTAKLLNTFSLQMALLGLVGTMLSGIIFLTSALLITGLPAPLAALISAVVVPTAITNGFIAFGLASLLVRLKKVTV